ncbi:hypothetical protein [Changchengzhania lutea]|uniref:hypothetical protein n=1 Tax=Changchengzhania lutea TaxID=2049305 RepID=UPI00115D211A|nr:hypothetical protein [Changchengzhania lutea]
MEADLGLRLFEHHNRKVELTNTETYLKKELTIHLKQLDDIIGHAQLLHDGKKGQLKMGYVGSAMQELIPNLLLEYRKNYSDIIISLKEMDNQKQIHDLQKL